MISPHDLWSRTRFLSRCTPSQAWYLISRERCIVSSKRYCLELYIETRIISSEISRKGYRVEQDLLQNISSQAWYPEREMYRLDQNQIPWERVYLKRSLKRSLKINYLLVQSLERDLLIWWLISSMERSSVHGHDPRMMWLASKNIG